MLLAKPPRTLAFLLARLALPLAFLAPYPALAAEGFFLGDSIAAAIAQTIGMRGVARHSVSLRRHDIGQQFAYLPKGAIGILSLSLNDAADPVEYLKPFIERVIEKAERTGAKFVWMGPPCVFKSWDNRAKDVDTYLRERLARSTTIQFVSLRDPQICARGMRSPDGEHFTDAGYRYVWAKIRNDSSFAQEIEMPSRPNLMSATMTAPNKARSPK